MTAMKILSAMVLLALIGALGCGSNAGSPLAPKAKKNGRIFVHNDLVIDIPGVDYTNSIVKVCFLNDKGEVIEEEVPWGECKDVSGDLVKGGTRIVMHLMAQDPKGSLGLSRDMEFTVDGTIIIRVVGIGREEGLTLTIVMEHR